MPNNAESAARELARELLKNNTQWLMVTDKQLDLLTTALKRCRNETLEEAAQVCDRLKTTMEESSSIIHPVTKKYNNIAASKSDAACYLAICIRARSSKGGQ